MCEIYELINRYIGTLCLWLGLCVCDVIRLGNHIIICCVLDVAQHIDGASKIFDAIYGIRVHGKKVWHDIKCCWFHIYGSIMYLYSLERHFFTFYNWLQLFVDWELRVSDVFSAYLVHLFVPIIQFNPLTIAIKFNSLCTSSHINSDTWLDVLITLEQIFERNKMSILCIM